MAVMTALPRYEDQGRPFMAFVYGIAAHKVADGFRNASRNKSDPVGEIPERASLEGGPESHALATEASRDMARLLSTLPEKQREILILRVVVGLSVDQEYFDSLAKVRAMRLIWANLSRAFGAETPAVIEARSSRRMLSASARAKAGSSITTTASVL